MGRRSPGVAPPLVPWLAACVVALQTAIPAGAEHDDPRVLPGHWIERCPDPQRVLLEPAEVERANRRLLALDRSVRDMTAVPERMPGAEVASAVTDISRLLEGAFYHHDGTAVSASDRDRWGESLALDEIPTEVSPRFAVVVKRAALRRFPTRERVHAGREQREVDLFQESAFFPGTVVAVVHAPAAGRWSFVLGPTYAAWIETEALGVCTRAEALAYAAAASRMITAPQVAVPVPSGGEVLVDMGVAFPPAGPAAAAVLFPRRCAAGGFEPTSATLPPAADVHDGPLPVTRANLLRQAFRFRGERYGWGHDHAARDCSGLVCEVYRSLGLLLPRNTRDQRASPAFDRTVIDPVWSRERRVASLAGLLPGDLVFSPGHVMMVIGQDDGAWVIHDTLSGRMAGRPVGSRVSGVIVARLEDILADRDATMVDTIEVIVRVLPR